ncbi:MAG: hypothetical protein ACI81L_000052 [Verrucomicrobiales bacterium]|jgi:hypothetical protein
MKKGRHRRFEEARALKRSHEVDLHDLFDSISDSDEGEHKPEHDAWADLAEEWDSSNTDDDATTTPASKDRNAASELGDEAGLEEDAAS